MKLLVRTTLTRKVSQHEIVETTTKDADRDIGAAITRAIADLKSDWHSEEDPFEVTVQVIRAVG